MNRFKSKKGFTLAELLIVVAIIAVLVAIAVPLFVSGLKKAEEARDDANVRSVKSAAAVIILSHTGEDKYWDGDSETDGLQAPAGWSVTATIDGNGKITLGTSAIAPLKDAAAVTAYQTTGDGKTECSWTSGTCTIHTVVLPTDLETA